MEAASRRRAVETALLVAALMCCPGLAAPSEADDSVLPQTLPFALFLLPPPPAQHVEPLHKRQAVYEATVDEENRPQLELMDTTPKGPEETQQVKATQPQDTSSTTRLRPLLVARFYPELQPGYGHDDSLGAKDSYASVPAPDDSTNLTGDEQIPDALYAPNPPSSLGSTHQQQPSILRPRQKKSSTNLKKLLNKPKKMMEVMTATEEGEMIPEAVPGVMLPTDDGTEEAFVPADLLEYADTLLTSSSTLNPTVVLPTHGEAPMKGMPYNFAFIVDDEATSNYQTRQETGDIHGVVTGCFQVLDPNGLVRTTTYRADDSGFHIISLTRSPDKTPCPGLDDATRSPVPLPAPTERPSPASYGQNNNGAFANDFNSFGRFNSASSSSSSASSSSSQESSSSSSSQYSGSSSFNVKNGLADQAAVSHASGRNVLSQEQRMAQYLQEITKNLYNSYSNSSSTSENHNSNSAYNSYNENLINFPFVLIPIKTFLDLQNSGAIADDVQSYGAFVQPQPYQVNGQRQQQQQRQQKQYSASKTTKQASSNAYNSAQSSSQQAGYRGQGINSGAQQGYGQQGSLAYGQQQQYQKQQSSQSSKKSSSSSSSSQQAAYASQGLNAGYQPASGHGQQAGQAYGQQQQYQSHQSQASQESSSKSSSSSSQQSAYLNQGINSGYQQAAGHGQQGNRGLGLQQQYQSQQSSQSAKKSSSSSSNSASSSFSAFGNQQGYGGRLPYQGSGTTRPAPTYGTPTATRPAPTYGTPTATRPAPTYGTPTATRPAPTYGTPTATRPAPTYGTPTATRPAPTYGTPTATRPAPTYGTHTSTRPAPTYGTPTATRPVPTYGTPKATRPTPTYGTPTLPGYVPPSVATPARTSPPKPTIPTSYRPQPQRPVTRPAFNHNNGGLGGSRYFSQNSQSSQKASQSSEQQQQQQAYSGVNYNNGGLAAQSYHASSAKSASEDKSSKSSSSSSQYVGNSGHQGGGGASLQASNFKSASSASSSSSSSSEKSSSSFIGASGFGFGGQNLNAPSFPQLASYEPQSAHSTLSSTVLPASPSPAPQQYNAIAPPAIKVPASSGHQNTHPQPNLINVAASYHAEPEPVFPDYSLFSPPAAEPTYGMEGWTPITNDYQAPPSPPQVYGGVSGHNNNANTYNGNNNNYNNFNQNNNAASFAYSSDQSSSHQSSSSQQSHQQSSAVYAAGQGHL